jgi:hypothetical protein
MVASCRKKLHIDNASLKGVFVQMELQFGKNAVFFMLLGIRNEGKNKEMVLFVTASTLFGIVIVATSILFVRG